MSSTANDRVPPPRAALAHFLAKRQAQSTHAVAQLLGWTPAQVRERAADEESRSGDTVPWCNVAAWLVETWSLPALFRALGDDAPLLPAGLQVVRVSWELPIYIVHALRVQAAIEPLPHRTLRPDTDSEYMRDLLHRSIDGTTVAMLRDDELFMAAFEFPWNTDD